MDLTPEERSLLETFRTPRKPPPATWLRSLLTRGLIEPEWAGRWRLSDAGQTALQEAKGED